MLRTIVVWRRDEALLMCRAWDTCSTIACCRSNEHGDVEHLLTDNGRETCGKPMSHPFELFLTLSQIEPRRTQVGSPETNGIYERLPIGR